MYIFITESSLSVGWFLKPFRTACAQLWSKYGFLSLALISWSPTSGRTVYNWITYKKYPNIQCHHIFSLSIVEKKSNRTVLPWTHNMRRAAWSNEPLCRCRMQMLSEDTTFATNLLRALKGGESHHHCVKTHQFRSITCGIGLNRSDTEYFGKAFGTACVLSCAVEPVDIALLQRSCCYNAGTNITPHSAQVATTS